MNGGRDRRDGKDVDWGGLENGRKGTGVKGRKGGRWEGWRKDGEKTGEMQKMRNASMELVGNFP